MIYRCGISFTLYYVHFHLFNYYFVTYQYYHFHIMNLTLTVKGAITHYCQLILISVITITFAIPIVISLSYLPFGTFDNGSNNYFVSKTVVGTFVMATTLFGPIYFAFEMYVMIGWTRVMQRNYHYSVIGHAFLWPIFYFLLGIILEINFWYWYLDFAWFGFAFVPLACHAAYSVLWIKGDASFA